MPQVFHRRYCPNYTPAIQSETKAMQAVSQAASNPMQLTAQGIASY
jgi:hypothetical protein